VKLKHKKQGLLNGNKKRERPKTRSTYNIKNICGRRFVEVCRLAHDKTKWSATIQHWTVRLVMRITQNTRSKRECSFFWSSKLRAFKRKSHSLY